MFLLINILLFAVYARVLFLKRISFYQSVLKLLLLIFSLSSLLFLSVFLLFISAEVSSINLRRVSILPKQSLCFSFSFRDFHSLCPSIGWLGQRKRKRKQKQKRISATQRNAARSVTNSNSIKTELYFYNWKIIVCVF
jgi:hypothetical protein